MSETSKKRVPIVVFQVIIAIVFLAAWEWGSAAKLLDLLAIPAGERQFSELGGDHRIASGSTLPAPSPVFPRYVDSEASAQT